MFSYRHAFHAGNHADVLKHAMLVHMLDHFGNKDAPYWVIDTHAGAGLYALDGDWANKRAEYADGIARIWPRRDLPALLARYVEAVAQLNPDGALRRYPGSPWLALQALRERDRLRLFELHPTETQVLQGNLEKLERKRLRQVTLYAADGFDGVQALLPPPTRRGMTVIDPSYEDKRDYRRALEAVREGLKRFATGTFVVWYPLVQRREAQELPRQLARLPVQDWLDASLTVRKPAADGLGLHGSGMFVVNPPWTLMAALRQALPWLARELAQDERAGWRLDGRQK
ncbi:23S rRNA (adenine(2030)-N(6))-methyltransferase RlmJ [Orrella sp. JC864]|uniref:23S rRNA (adenine(2030)-N(6))-methyltransferase RlmJ n=1 Tax=Orrella sp. JC864 TaxID=3120298 RepID=UPI00300B243B